MLHLKEIRTRKEKTQAEIARLLKITRASYANIENGRRDPDTTTLLALSDFFGVTLDEIFGRGTEKVQFTAEEMQLIEDYRSLNREGQEKIREEIYMMAVSGIYKNSNDVSRMENS